MGSFDGLAAAAVVIIVLTAMVVILAARRRQELLSVLVGVSGGLFAAQIAQVHVFTFVVVVWALVGSNEARRAGPIHAVLVVACAAVLAVTSVTGELVNSPALGLQLIALACSSALIVARSSASDIQRMLLGLLAVSSVGSLWALLQVGGLVPSNAWHLSVSALGRPTGIYPEPDWLGMFAGVGLVLAWRLPLHSKMRVVLVPVNGFALALAFARAAWLAVAVSVAFAGACWLLSRRSKLERGATKLTVARRSGRVNGAFVLISGGAVALALVPSLAQDLITRLSRTLVVHEADVSAMARVQQNDALGYLARTAPWNGHGLSSSGRVGVSGRIDYGESANNVGSNWLVSLWVDGAFLSLPLIVLLMVVTALSLRSIAGQLLLLVLVNSFFSNATYQPVAWMLLGLCMAELKISQDRRVERNLADSRHGPLVRKLRSPKISHVPSSA